MRVLLIAVLVGFSGMALAQATMAPNKDPVPSPSDLRAATGEDRATGEAREDRTPSPSDVAVEAPRIDGDRRTDAIPDTRNAAAGSSAGQPIPFNGRGEPIRTR